MFEYPKEGFFESAFEVIFWKCTVYLVTELNRIRDNVTKTQREMSSIKFYNLINQNTVISNKDKNINSYLYLHKSIPVIIVEEQNS